MTWSRREILTALTAGAGTLAVPTPVRAATLSGVTARLMVVYLPNGLQARDVVPAGSTLDDPLPTGLAPLAPWVDHLTVVSGLHSVTSSASNLHAAAAGAALTGEDLHAGSFTGANRGRSMDQVAADAIGTASPIPSLVTCSEGLPVCPPDVGWTARDCLYQNHVSYRGLDDPRPVETSVSAILRQLTGRPDGTEAARRRIALDAVARDAKRWSPVLDAAQRAVVDSWMSHLSEAIDATQAAACPVSDADAALFLEADQAIGAHMDAMLRLHALALHCDATRVGVWSPGREFSRRVLPAGSLGLSHHAVSHHGGRTEYLDDVTEITVWHMDRVAGLLGALAAMPTVAGHTVLDETLVLILPGFGDGQVHAPVGIPAVLAGGSALGLPGGRHLVATGTKLASLHLAILQMLGLSLTRFATTSQPLAIW